VRRRSIGPSGSTGLLALSFLLCAAPIFAAITGEVRNQTTGKPQPGATVALYKLGTQNGLELIDQAKSDAQGQFSINREVLGPHLIRTAFDGVTCQLGLMDIADLAAACAAIRRVLRPGGTLVAVDNDYRWGEFATMLAAAAPAGSPARDKAASTGAWWRERGAVRREVRSGWTFDRRSDLEAVLNIEFPATVASAWLTRNPAATGLSYGYVLFAVNAPALG